ncbi:ABC transporter substrate-binding protein [Vicingaceae bacterium]|nr:ABC transporter substrate-binding protein [Vicingaceae bacterium]
MEQILQKIFGIKKVDKRFMKSSAFIFCCMMLLACNDSKLDDSIHDSIQGSSLSHFSIKDSVGITIIEIFEPFLHSSKTERYVLYPKLEGKPKGIKADIFIGLPIERIGINSTTHLGYLKELNKHDKITAVSNTSLFYDEDFQKSIQEGKVTELGSRSLNTELVIESDLDVLFTFAIDAASYNEIERLRTLGQPVVLISEFMESDPLKKAQWLKVFAAFFDDSTKRNANSHLQMIQQRYDSIKNQSMLYSFLPKVAIGLPWKGSWYVSGGESYQAKLIHDASASYIWNDYLQSASVPLNIETAISRSMQADFWINPGRLASKGDLSNSNIVFEQFSSFRNQNIYTNYKRSNKFGGNDYWEMGVVRPDLILSDLVSIFHNHANDSLIFYKSIFE